MVRSLALEMLALGLGALPSGRNETFIRCGRASPSFPARTAAVRPADLRERRACGIMLREVPRAGAGKSRRAGGS